MPKPEQTVNVRQLPLSELTPAELQRELTRAIAPITLRQYTLEEAAEMLNLPIRFVEEELAARGIRPTYQHKHKKRCRWAYAQLHRFANELRREADGTKL